MSKAQLLVLLQNLYNSTWPKDFNAEGFCMPDPECTAVSDPKQLLTLTEIELRDMARAIIHENEALRDTGFYRQWIQPLNTILQLQIH